MCGIKPENGAIRGCDRHHSGGQGGSRAMVPNCDEMKGPERGDDAPKEGGGEVRAARRHRSSSVNERCRAAENPYSNRERAFSHMHAIFSNANLCIVRVRILFIILSFTFAAHRRRPLFGLPFVTGAWKRESGLLYRLTPPVAVGWTPLPFAMVSLGTTTNMDVYGSGHAIDWKVHSGRQCPGGVKRKEDFSLPGRAIGSRRRQTAKRNQNHYSHRGQGMPGVNNNESMYGGQCGGQTPNQTPVYSLSRYDPAYILPLRPVLQSHVHTGTEFSLPPFPFLVTLPSLWAPHFVVKKATLASRDSGPGQLAYCQHWEGPRSIPEHAA
ncbi:hypothetical protein EDB84DRAFT_1436856 [Lactarius hengduanensis]|nr:hypothetical protein EDB84DRAFT_1436856 [Lactarius hengduanensis]